MTEHKMDVDLTEEPEEPEEPQTVNAAVGETPATGADEETLTPKEVARRLLDSADSPSEALRGAEQALSEHLQKYEKCQRSVEDQRTRIDSLQKTAERVAALPDDALCIQTLEGGISVEVRSDEHDDDHTRSDLIDEIYDAIETREELIDNGEERLKLLEAECATIRQAAADIENLKELTGDTLADTQRDPQGVPEEDRWPEG
jgi:DNA repair exonuclease SbcCD ATPase subunit